MRGGPAARICLQLYTVRSSRLRRTLAGACLLALGCGEVRSDGEPMGSSASASVTDSGSSTGAVSSSAPSSGNGPGSAAESGATSDGTGDPIFDVGSMPDGGPPVTPGCDKVDFLFVIDNSESMADEQDSLVASVPGFIAGIESTLSEVEGFHVGVISTDEYARNPEECRELGALITQTGGEGSSNMVCGPFAEGGRYMTEADDFDHAFACTAAIGIAGDGNERTVDALLAALSVDANAPGACNEGFIRDDALLVVVLITDEEDDHEMLAGLQIAGSQGHPPDWYQALLDRKGVPENVAILSLVGHDKPNACPDFQWDGFDGAEIATRLIALTEMFDNGFVGDICAPDYDAFFSEAVAVVQTACDGFIPQG